MTKSHDLSDEPKILMPATFYIDITETLTKFKEYFEHSERMILSAKFGDGKSYLLNKFMEEDDPKDPKYSL